MPNETILAGVIVVAVVVYTLTGGADFGGGVLEALARGPRAKQQREAVATTIGPIWEANHVWLILVIVLLFATFPPAFAAIATALHIPLTVMLIGIVARGTAFVFRAYDEQDERTYARWTTIFAAASIATPVALGVCAGAVSTGAIIVGPTGVESGFFSGWTTLFALSVGLLLLALCTFLAATYMCVQTEGELADDFARNALGAAGVVAAAAAATLGLAHGSAPLIWAGLTSGFGFVIHGITAAAAIGAIVSLRRKRWKIARICAATQAATIVGGWARAQYPYLIVDDITFASAVAEPAVTTSVLIALAAGSVVLLPSFVFLYRVFGSQSSEATGSSEKN